jgi:hypothetical protein
VVMIENVLIHLPPQCFGLSATPDLNPANPNWQVTTGLHRPREKQPQRFRILGIFKGWLDPNQRQPAHCSVISRSPRCEGNEWVITFGLPFTPD